ncbi:MAG: mechanosensitive ion channel [Rhodanobacter sp.]|nr:mechanosensitive ion channel [Rhodanobacter sp.]
MHAASSLGSAATALAPTAPAVVKRGIEQVGDWLDMGFKFGGVDVTIGSVLGALLLLVIFLQLSAVLKRLLRRYVQRNANVNQSTVYTVERLVHYLLLTIGVLWALSVAGIPMAKMSLFAGALGVGLGFGLQAIFNNFVSGLILLFERSLKVGDFVELASGVHGNVRDIYIRSTRITTNDDIDILVPNSEFVNGRVVNWTLREVARRLKIPFGVAYGTDKELVKKAGLEAAAAVPFTLSLDGPRGPQVWLTGFGDSSLDFQLVVWLNADATRRPGAVTAAYYWALHTALEKYDIEIPFPQRDLHVKSWVRPAPREDNKPAAAGSTSPGASAHDNDAARDVARDIAEESASRSDASSPNDPREAH